MSASPLPARPRVRNWAGTRHWRPTRILRPNSLAEAVDQVAAHAEAGHTLTPAGSRHSFSEVAVTDDVQIELTGLRGVVDADPRTGRVTFWAGTRLSEVVTDLAGLGLALDSMGDIDRQTLAGAIATGTHGTGLHHTGYAGAITGLQLVTADGTVRWLTAEHPEFQAACVCLGTLGLITQVQLQCVPAFRLHCVQHQEPAEQVLESFAERAEHLDHPEFFWFPAAPVITVKSSTRHPQNTPARRRHPWVRWAGEHLADNLGLEAISRLATLAPSTTPALNRFAAAAMSTRDEVEDSHRVFVSPRTVRFREMEYALDLSRAPETFDGIREIFAHLARRGHRVSFPLEVRVGRGAGLDVPGTRTSHPLRSSAPIPPPGRRGGVRPLGRAVPGPGWASALGQNEHADP